MPVSMAGFFTQADRLQMESLAHRQRRSQVIGANIANAETPGFRALGYDFEDQLQELGEQNNPLGVRVSDPRHKQHAFTSADGTIRPEVYVQATESVGNDGNTVDLDREMVTLSQNQILYRSAVESISRKIGLLKYAINGGR